MKNKESKQLVIDYLSTTELTANGIYKLEPFTTIHAFVNWLKNEGYIIIKEETL